MKIIIITLFIGGLIGVIAYLFMPRSKLVILGDFSSLTQRFKELTKGSPEIGALIIAINGKEDFIQFSRDGTSIQLDYPLISSRQKELEQKYRAICKDLDLELQTSTGSDGSRFLDAAVPSEPTKLSHLSKTILERLYEANDATKLKFTLLPN